ncbi:MAG: 50S ribosomal protein L25 [Bacteroidales bacterium]|jgi:large subunit ribosomal protein L25
MKSISLSGSARQNVGKKDAKLARKQGLVPCVIYGAEEHKNILIEEKYLNKCVFTPDIYLIRIDVDGVEYIAVIKDLQFHPVTDTILHVDFYEVTKGKPFIVRIPVRLHGTAKGVLSGGILNFSMRKLKLKGLFVDIPDDIEIDISEVDFGKPIYVGDIKIPNVEILDDANEIIVDVIQPRVLELSVEEGEQEEGEEGAEGDENTEKDNNE